MTLRKILTLLITVPLFSFSLPAMAEEGLISTSRKVDQSLNPGTVYYSGNYPGAVLMRVNMLGEVQRPGVHHMPVETDFNTALGFAGGPTRFANTKDAVIKRRIQKGGEEVIPVNLNTHFSEVHREQLQLKPNDTLYIPQTQGVISDNSMRVVMVLSLVVGTVLSVVSVHNLTKGN